MSTYIIGDIHGCYDELCLLLKLINFKVQNDTLWLTGDLVSRGPGSLQVLRYLKKIRSSVRIVLGNHDLNLLRLYCKNSLNKQKDNLNELIHASDFDELIDWLRKQPLVQIDKEKKIIMVHAGIIPEWNIEDLCMYSKKIESILSSNNYSYFINSMHEKTSSKWSYKLSNIDQLRFVIKTLTRLRYCFPDGKLDMLCKENPKKAFHLLKPWFTFKNKIPEEYSFFFGHWASLEGKNTPRNMFAMDTGCCWGGCLTLFHWETKKYYHQKSCQKKRI
ncbi:Bis(5'-nucleosyl)-tetraphosphatase [symmetrical] [Candidatus Providencia siddallii]|uniref:Bis(5'-nucleosyl)-tetraphosphatase, symmetrical n=1 Tax=Candidatus Providencia siddallii TaxID=1715285 RepID=A0A0M6W854_9GAMM|nr:Bis(5'-nucleosyl)-tetraphosphatase [symmetrical] [Candidatus Providencia siddallii]